MRKYNYKRLIYKKKYSLSGILLFILIFFIEILWKFSIKLVKSLIKFVKWYKKYIQFVKSGYSYSDIYNIIKQLSGREFEILCFEIFKALGYNIRLTQACCDGGKDLIIYDNKKGYTYVECKRWTDSLKVGRPELMKLVGASIGDNIDYMLFITTSDYTDEAYEYAKKIESLELWDMDDIMKLVVKVDHRKLPLILTKTLGTNNKIIKLNPVRN